MIKRLRKTHFSKNKSLPSDSKRLDGFFSENQITSREKEIIELIIQGKTNKEIAEELFLSIQTIKNYIHTIFQKLGITNRGKIPYLMKELKEAGVEEAGAAAGEIPAGSKETSFKPRIKRTVLFISLIIIFFAALFTANKLLKLGDNILYLQKESSLAILPFKDLSPQQDHEYLCDGLVEEIIFRLSHLDNLRVPARTSSFSFKEKTMDVREIGRILNVEHVLEGSVRKAENKLRITVQLIDINTSDRIWSDRYDCTMEDIFEIEDSISLTIVNNLKINLFTEEKEKLTKAHTKDLKAYNAYLKGKWHFNRRSEDDLQKAIQYYEEAIASDTEYAEAYIGLANTYAIMPDYSSAVIPLDSYRKSKGYALQALKINNEIAEGHTVLAVNIYRSDYDWESAESEFNKAITLSPSSSEAHHWYALFLMFQARFDEAMGKIETARKLDPLSLVVNRNIGAILFYARRYDEALEAINKTLDLDSHFIRARYFLGKIYLQKSMFDKALVEFEKEKNSLAYMDPTLEAQIGITKAKMGKMDEARAVFNDLILKFKNINTINYESAILCFALGEKDQGMNFLQRAYEHRETQLCYLKVDPCCDPVRDDNEFKKLLKKIGL